MSRIPERFKGELPGEIKKARDDAYKYHEDKLATEEANRPGWKDNMMMAPISEWDKSDREGKVGKRAFVLPGSRIYKERYDMIDWSR